MDFQSKASRTPPNGSTVSDPVRLGPKGVVRWRAMSTDGRCSPSFKMWISGDDAYVAQQSSNSRSASIGGRQRSCGLYASRDRGGLDWQGGLQVALRLDCASSSIPGWKELFAVHPPRARTQGDVRGWAWGSRIYLIFTHQMVRRQGCISSAVIQWCSRGASCFPGRSMSPSLLNPGDIDFHLLALLHPWGEEEREWARKARLAEPGSSERSIAQPGGVDPASPTARLLKLVRTTDGGRWYVDLAGHEPVQ